MLFVGLGNPGEKYSYTRHNLGALVVEQLITSLEGDTFKFKNVYKALVTEVQSPYKGEKTTCILPQTYMNLSGDSVQKVLAYKKLSLDKLVIFYDETELPAGVIRYKWSGGHRGHNGVRDIINKLGSADFHRICLGIGRPPKGIPISLSDYVLSKIPEEVIPSLADIELLLREQKLW